MIDDVTCFLGCLLCIFIIPALDSVNGRHLFVNENMHCPRGHRSPFDNTRS